MGKRSNIAIDHGRWYVDYLKKGYRMYDGDTLDVIGEFGSWDKLIAYIEEQRKKKSGGTR